MTRATEDGTHEESWLDRYAPLNGLDGDLRAAFAALPRRAIPEGAILFSPGAPCQGFALVLEGRVRVDVTGASGRSILLYRIGAGETCVQTTLCLLGEATYTATAVAETALTLAMAPRPLFERAIAGSDVFRRFVFRMFAARLDETTRLLESVAFVRVEARLAAALAQRARRAGAAAFDVTHQELADEIGTAREVVSRQLDGFRRDGLIVSARGRLEVLNPSRLDALARSA